MGSPSLLTLLLLLLAALPVLLGAPAEAAAGAHTRCDFPAIFNFGDSNSDTGGLSAAFGPAPPPNGETYFGRPAGRFSDGRLIIDFLAESVGLPHLSAYLDSIGSNFTHGANFATAGSTVRRQNTTLFQSGFSPISLDVQFWEFSQFRTRSQQQVGVFKELMPREDYFSRALYTFDIGQNDLTSGYYANMTTDQVKAYIPDVIDKLVAVIKGVYDHGGRTFWIHNTGPFGCLPYILDRVPLRAPEVDRNGCGAPFNEVARAYNAKLGEAVKRLRKELPLAAFTYVDVYTLKYALFTNASKYGFDHPLMACCGHGGKYHYDQHIGCGATVAVNGTKVVLGESCEEPARRIIWDGVHYTEAANRWVSDQMAGGLFSDPPLPASMACHRNGHA